MWSVVALCSARVGPVSIFMARVLGESGRYVSEQATRRLHSIWAWGIYGMAAMGAVLGFLLRGAMPWFRLSPTQGLLFSTVLLLAFFVVAKITFRRLNELERERNNMRKGAMGEKSVGAILSGLPEEFRAINDLSTPTGNLDHVVVGPTGVFVIETKNCRGVIDASADGELTLNGKPAEQRHVSKFVGRMMGVREKILVLAPGIEPFFQAVMVFTSAWVGCQRVGSAECMTDDRLVNYILDEKKGKRLTHPQIDLLARAFASLARMDPGFDMSVDACEAEGTTKASEPEKVCA